MNTVSCPEGLFTDEILVLPELTAFCQGRVAVWFGLVVPLLAVRCWLLIPQIVDQRRRQQKKRNLRSPSTRGRFSESLSCMGCCSARIPFFLISQIASTFFSTVFVVLTSTLTINARNGSSFVVFGFFTASVAMGHLIMARTIIKLGRKIIPLSEKRLQTVNNNNGGDALKDLAKIDIPLRVFGVLGAMASIIAVILFIISPAFDGRTRSQLFRASFFAIAAYQLLLGASIVYQFKRCLSAITKLTFGNSSGTTGDGAVSPEKAKSDSTPTPSSPSARKTENSRSASALSHAILTMRVQMGIISLTASIMMVLSLLFATLVLPLQYWIYSIVFIFVDVFFQSSLLFAPMLGKLTSNGSKGSKDTDDKPQGIGATGGEMGHLTTMGDDNTRTVTHISSRFNPQGNSVVGSSFAAQ